MDHETEIGAAIEELRELAPASIPRSSPTRAWQGAAVEALCERAAIQVRVVAVPEAVPPPAEAAAFFLIAEACGKIASNNGSN